MKLLALKFSLILITLFVFGCSGSQNITTHGFLNIDTIKAQKFDTGKMWTFDNPPVDYFYSTYGFKPDQGWLDNTRKAALKFANYCSASFISEDGLIMTNDHCGRQSVTAVTKENEDLQESGFFADSLQNERKVDGLYVEQLLYIKDVTNDVQSAIDAGNTDAEKQQNKENIFSELKDKFEKETGLKISVVTLYNGGKYSVYGYKRFEDIRLVFAPETQMAFFGGDYDNFTYPRYNLDVTFFRAYDDSGKPLKTKNYFKWSDKGAAEGEPIFVVGNPGKTNRLNTFAQLEYMRDYQYPGILSYYSGIADAISKIISTNPPDKAVLQDKLYSYSNAMKVYEGMIRGLNDPVLMARKLDFEKQFKSAVNSNPKLKDEYGDLWNKISGIRGEIKKIAPQVNAYGMNPAITSEYFIIAKNIVEYANEMQYPENQRLPQYTTENIDSIKNSLFPDSLDTMKANAFLKAQVNYIIANAGLKDKNVNEFTNNLSGYDAVNSILDRSLITNKTDAAKLLENSPSGILKSDDPFIKFIVNTSEIYSNYSRRVKELTEKEDTYKQKLGKALFDVYGYSIPPDANFTLRISDGVVEGYPYNGTIAPAKVTYYGLYDRYYSFQGKYPWNLPDRWKNPPPEFDLSIPFNFVSTNDIIGGNSGSPVINTKGEIVGLAFDGNMESLPGNIIFDAATNRCLSVDSEGMMEAIQDIYKANRLSEELKLGKIPIGK